jgi:hypothetical protein
MALTKSKKRPAGTAHHSAGDLVRKFLVTTRFSRTLNALEIPHRCWSAVVYNYWQTGDFFPRIDLDRLVADIRARKLQERRCGFGSALTKDMEEWLRMRDEACD